MRIAHGLWAFGVLFGLALPACDEGAEQAEKAKAAAAASAAALEQKASDEKAEAARQVRIADAKAEPARNEARIAIRKTLSEADRTAMDLKERLGKAKGSSKAKAGAASADYDKARTAAERDIEGLNTASGSAWDALKEQTDKDLATLKSSLDAFAKSFK
jgi:hypothetical protein